MFNLFIFVMMIGDIDMENNDSDCEVLKHYKPYSKELIDNTSDNVL